MQFNSATGQYVDDSGQFVSRGTILGEAQSEKMRLAVRLKGHARLFTQGRIEIGEFQSRVANDIKLSHLRMSAFGAGGKDNLTPAHYGSVGARLREEYRKHLFQFGEDLESGNLTEAQILHRTERYAQSSVQTFYRSEQISRAGQGFNEARRMLDPGARHCAECPGYSTNGEWLPIEEVVSPGHACSCRGNCKCIISYRRNTNILNRASVLQNRVKLEQEISANR